MTTIFKIAAATGFVAILGACEMHDDKMMKDDAMMKEEAMMKDGEMMKDDAMMAK